MRRSLCATCLVSADPLCLLLQQVTLQQILLAKRRTNLDCRVALTCAVTTSSTWTPLGRLHPQSTPRRANRLNTGELAATSVSTTAGSSSRRWTCGRVDGKSDSTTRRHQPRRPAADIPSHVLRTVGAVIRLHHGGWRHHRRQRHLGQRLLDCSKCLRLGDLRVGKSDRVKKQSTEETRRILCGNQACRMMIMGACYCFDKICALTHRALRIS